MALSIDIKNPCKTRALRVGVEEKRDGAWALADVRLLAPGETFTVELERGQRRVEMREVPTWCKNLIESCRTA